MNLAATSPLWLVWLLGALLAAAAIEDAMRLRITNLICLSVLVLALVGVAMAHATIDLWQNFAVFTSVLVAGTFLFSAGKLGDGDVKLLATLSLWFSFRGALMLLPTSSWPVALWRWHSSRGDCWSAVPALAPHCKPEFPTE